MIFSSVVPFKRKKKKIPDLSLPPCKKLVIPVTAPSFKSFRIQPVNIANSENDIFFGFQILYNTVYDITFMWDLLQIIVNYRKQENKYVGNLLNLERGWQL
jgi:hypothetical protein